MPGTIIAGNVRERNNGGGIFREFFLSVAVWAAIAAAAALKTQGKTMLKRKKKKNC